VITPNIGRTARGIKEVAGIGIGSKTHQTTHRIVTPKVYAADAENPLSLIR
tara:strand:+ start:1053 stop:1205 length:153 start_codon:yes stop_codon:yes gene_type:complete